MNDEVAALLREYAELTQITGGRCAMRSDVVVVGAGLFLAVYGWRFLLPLVGPATPRADDFQDYLFAAHQIATGGDPYANFIRNVGSTRSRMNASPCRVKAWGTYMTSPCCRGHKAVSM